MSLASANVEEGNWTQWMKGKLRVNWAFTLLEAVLWVWSIGVCIPFWITDPNYGYGWAVPFLMFFFLWRRLGAQDAEFWRRCGEDGRSTIRIHPWILAFAALGLFPLEVYRIEYLQSGLVLWGINLTKVAFSVLGAWWLGGHRLVILTLFPLLFFLTAVPWPAKIAGPLQQNLMIGVANVVTEILLWLAIPVRLEGAVLHLTKGTVGIVEACSGIRSLQSGLMISLAVGELYWLSRGRRAGLVGFAILLALVSNLGRTFALCWILETRGSDAMHAAHDTVGNIAMYSLYALIWAFGWYLARGTKDIWPTKTAGTWSERISKLSWEHVPDFRPLLIATVAMFLVIQTWYEVLKRTTPPQLVPQFSARVDEMEGLTKMEWDQEVWNALHADYGDRLELKVPDAPLGTASASHIFYKPSLRIRQAMIHRPDVCMPGSGWKIDGKVEGVTVEMDGYPLDFLVFQFQKDQVRAVQVWGFWRNGKAVEFDYGVRAATSPERFGIWPSARNFSSIEVVSIFVPFLDGKPPIDIALRELSQMFHFEPFNPDEVRD
jgi:exosortase